MSMRPAARPPRRKARHPPAWAALLLAAWTLLPAAAWGQNEAILIVRVVVNGKSFGNMDVRLGPGGEVLMSLANLNRLDLPDLPVFLTRSVGGVGYLSMSDLYPRVAAHLDRAAATLSLSVRQKPPPEPPKPRVGVRTFEAAVVAVDLNRAPIGTRIVQLTGAGHVLMSVEDVQGLGVAHLPQGALSIVEGRRHVALDDLAPWLFYTLDDRQARLSITVDPARLSPTVVDMGPKSAPGTVRLDAPGGFLNYAADYLSGDSGRYSVLSVPLEAGERIRGAFAFTDAIYTRSDGGGPRIVNRVVRQESHLTFDDEPSLTRIRLGDAAVAGEPLAGSVRLGGLTVAREFAISPNFIRYPGIALSGSLATPSDVEVYSNGILIRRDRLPAGEFTYEDLPRTTGAGESEIVIRDAFGRESRIQTPFYVSPELLKPGLSAYSYAFGVRREDFGSRSFGYGGAVFSGTHRMGLSPWATAGLRVEADRHLANGGPDAAFLLGRAGEVDAAGAWSRADGSDGSAWRAAYAYAGRTVGMRLSALGRSREYANLSLAPDADRVRRDLLGTLSLRVPVLGSFSVSHEIATVQPGPNLERTSLFFARSVGRSTSLYVRASRTLLDDVEDDLFVGLSHYLGDSRSATADWQQHEETATARATVQQNAPLGPGWGYRVEADRTTDPLLPDHNVGAGFLEYHGPYGIYQADARAETATDSYRASAAGAVAWTGGVVHATRPVHDAFALVRVPGVEGVKIYQDSRLTARTGADGTAVVPDLISYVDNRVSIDPTDVPLGVDLLVDTRTVTLPYRGTGELTFPATRVQAVVGRVLFREGARTVPVELTWMTVMTGAGAQRVPVGRGGEFYLENPAPGDHSAKVTWKGRECAFTIHVPESEDVMLDLGKLVCGKR
jgi:outer membrane usher protein